MLFIRRLIILLSSQIIQKKLHIIALLPFILKINKTFSYTLL